MSRFAQILVLSAALLLPWAVGGCNDPQNSALRSDQAATPAQVAAMREPNVLGVAAFYDPFDPWIWSASHEKPRGIVIKALYLKGPNARGVFGDGTIRPRLYVRESNEKGEVHWRLAKEWPLTVEDAIPFRSKKPSEMGWGYRLHLTWDDLAQFAGQQVRLVVEFERVDGRTVTSGKKDFRVPTPNTA